MEDEEMVLVKTRSGELHYGYLGAIDVGVTRLVLARRIVFFSGEGINSVNELAKYGPGEQSKISEMVPFITILDASEIIPLTQLAVERLDKQGWDNRRPAPTPVPTTIRR